MSREVRLFEIWFRKEQRKNDLSDMKFYPADITDADEEAMFREVNQLLRLRSELRFVEHPTLY